MDKGVTIYVLELEGGKYYVGKTRKMLPDDRILEHFIGEGCAWTRRQKPLRVIETIENCSNFDEDKYTKEYMAKYGIDNVRGGAYCTLLLSKETKEFLHREIRGALDKCLNCGGPHFVSNCLVSGSPIKAIQASHGNKQKELTINEKENLPTQQSAFASNLPVLSKNKPTDIQPHSTAKPPLQVCLRCGNIGHSIGQCYATWHCNGYRLNSSRNSYDYDDDSSSGDEYFGGRYWSDSDSDY